MVKPILSVIAFLFAVNTGFAQQDSLTAAQYLTAANACIDRHQPDSARLLHRAAFDVYQKMDRLDWWHMSCINLAYGLADVLKRPFDAEAILDEAVNKAWRQPRNLAEWEQLVRVQMYKGYFYQWYIFDYANAVKFYEESFRLYVSQLGERNDKIANYIYHQLGNVYTRRGDYTRAEALLRRGIAYGEKYQQPHIGRYGDLAIILIDLGKNREALNVIQSGLNVKDAAESTLITTRLSEARAWLNLGDSPAALTALSRVLPLVNKMESASQKAYYLAGYHAMSAAIQDTIGNNNAALSSLKKAIQYEIQSQGTPLCREVGKAHCALGAFYLRHRQPAAALHEFQQALQSVIKTFKPAGDQENPQAQSFEAENTIIEALLGKARAFYAMQELEKALECYELIPVVETRLRATHAYESSSILALNESRLRFDEAVEIAWQLFDSHGSDRRYADRAFRLTEQARGMLLLQSLAQAQAKYQLPEDVRQRENDLNVKIAWYELEIAAEPAESERRQLLEKELFDLKQALEKFKSELRQRFPDYAALSDEIQFLDSRQAPLLLQKGQVLLDYFRTKQSVFVFAMDTNGRFLWRRAAIPANFTESVQQFMGYLQNGDETDKNGAATFRATAHAWYQLLLEPELKQLLPQNGSLIVIPDDALVFVPFEVLLRQPAAEGNWRDLPWLLQDYSTGYAYSATLLHMQQTISRKHREQHTAGRYAYGGFAPIYTASGVYNLTSTADLVKSAQQLLGGNTWCGAAANEPTFKKIAPECKVLLLAMHGLADAENPELSRLLFGDPAADSLENDNTLYASELQIMQLQADLAVLSACHSGFGKLQKGEGVFSLARAFARAGVPATVMSLWLLHENTAAPLVQSFLKYLQEGKTKDEALRLAKLDFLKNDANFEMAHPFFWAGVTTNGDMCALDLPKNNRFAGWWAAALVVVAAGGWWWRRKRVKAA
jgi:CHAT domain-containing protein